jgi:peptidoglycan/LPS O-acetylase OafA/YrhL
VCSLLAVAYGVALWVDPVRSGTALPFELAPLGGRFVGCWLFFLATLAAYAAAHGRWEESRVSLVGLTAFSLGALLAALRTFGGLEPSGPRYVAVLALIALAAIALAVASGRRATAGAAYARATST